MAQKSKFFRVVVEGDTVDGRNISAKEIKDIAETYNAATYGARVNLEHMRGLMADGPFQALGDVLSVKAQTDDMEIGGKSEKRLALYAEIKPLPQLIEINARGQKVYTSVEIAPNFANTGKAGLVGLAITDSPASLGTEILMFAAKNPDASPFTKRKQAPENLFSAARETKIEFLDEPAAQTTMLDAIKGYFDSLTEKLSAGDKAKDDAAAKAKETDAGSVTDANAQAFSKGMEVLAGALDKSIANLTAQVSGQAAALKALETKLDSEASTQFKQRPNQVGATDAAHQTDC